MKIYVTGSMTQIREIRLISEILLKVKDNDVRFVDGIKELTLEDYIKKRYDFIDWCDAVYILKKENGEVCDGVVYEKVYAEKQHKEIVYIG